MQWKISQNAIILIHVNIQFPYQFSDDIKIVVIYTDSTEIPV